MSTRPQVNSQNSNSFTCKRECISIYRYIHVFLYHGIAGESLYTHSPTHISMCVCTLQINIVHVLIPYPAALHTNSYRIITQIYILLHNSISTHSIHTYMRKGSFYVVIRSARSRSKISPVTHYVGLNKDTLNEVVLSILKKTGLS